MHPQHADLVSWLEGRIIKKVRSGPDGLEFVFDSTDPATTISLEGTFKVDHYGALHVIPTGSARFRKPKAKK